MSKEQAQGSILFKILIIVAVVILIAVIIIPGQIWQEEARINKVTLSDIESLYEAHRYYFKIKGEYTADMDALLTTVVNDSSLLLKQKVVDYTDDLKTAIDDFLEVPLIKSLVKVSQNINNIQTDFESNKLYFKKYDDIDQKAEELTVKVAVIQDGVDQEEYATMEKSLDSLLSLRRDLQDFQLQIAAQRSQILAQIIVSKLPDIDFQSIINYWTPLDQELTQLMLRVNSTDLKTRTAVADRVADFQQKVTSGFRTLQASNLQNSIQSSEVSSRNLKSVYEKFLTDFLTTEKYVQYKLTDVDSMLLHLNTNNFVTPLDGQPYHVEFMDTLGMVVEDPTLAKELNEQAMKPVNTIKGFQFMNAFANYLNTLDSIAVYSNEVKTIYRRNAEVHFKNKDLLTLLDEQKNTSTVFSYRSLESFVNETPNSKSFSRIKSMIEEALLGVGVFKQIAETNFYGKMDSVHLDIIQEMTNFNELISGIKKNTYSFDSLKTKLDADLVQVKSKISGSELIGPFTEIESELQNLFLFASDGKEETIYGIFKTKITNHGKMFGRTGEKSWEAE